MKLKEEMIKDALKKTKDLLKKRPNAKKIEKQLQKMDFKKPETVSDLVKSQGLNNTADRNKNTALYEQLKQIWDKI